MDDKDIETLTDFMLGDSVPKMLNMIHENEKLKKENDLIKEELNNLKNDITRVYNTMISLETINKQEMEDIEEI